MSNKPIDTMSILHNMGIKAFRARVAIQNYQLMHQMPMQAVLGRLGHSLGTAIAAEPDHIRNMTTKIESHQPNFCYCGETLYEMSAFVFSKDQLKDFAQQVLSAYGNNYADARMETLQKVLKVRLKSELTCAVSDVVDEVVDDL